MHELPLAETYRGIEIYGLQSDARIAEAKRQIDLVITMSSARRLAEFAMDHSRPPEARLLARRKAIAAHEERQRKEFDVDRLVACSAGIKRRESVLGRLMGHRAAGWWPDAWLPD